jgi:hypothetical protein
MKRSHEAQNHHDPEGGEEETDCQAETVRPLPESKHRPD